MLKERILVVEDEENIVLLITRILTRSNYEIILSVNSGEEAIEKALQLKPDLILMDVKLSGIIDGAQAAIEIKKHLDVPILFLSAYNEKSILEKVKLTDPSGYLLKPIQIDQLRIAVEFALYKHNQEIKYQENLKWQSTILSSISEAVIATDKNGKIKFINMFLAAMIGCDQNEIINKDISEIIKFVYPENFDISMSYKEASEQNTSVAISEVTIKSLISNREIEIEGIINPILDMVQNNIGMVFAFRDVTKRNIDKKEIQTKEATFRELFNNTNSGVIVIEAIENGVDFLLKDINRAGEKISNLTKSEFIGKRFTDLFYNSPQPSLLKNLRQVHKTGIPIEIPLVYFEDERSSGWRKSYIYKLPTNEVVMVYDDITKQKQLEEALIERQEWYETTLKSIGDAVITTDINGYITFMNHIAEKLTGWLFKDTNNKTVSEIFNIYNEFTYQAVENPIERVIKEGVIFGLANHTILKSKDRTIYPIEDTAAPIKSKDGTIIGTVLVFHDVSKRRLSDQLIREKELLLSKTEALAHIGSWKLDFEKNILFWSDEMYKIFGVDTANFDGNLDNIVKSVIRPKDRDKIKDINSFLLSSNIKFPFEYKIVLPNGNAKNIWIDGGNYIYDKNGVAVALTGYVHDITERKLAEQKIKKSEEKFRIVFEQSPIGIEFYDIKGKLITANKACLDIFGIESINDIIGFNLFEDPNLQKDLLSQLYDGNIVNYETMFDFNLVKKHNLYKSVKEGFIYIQVFITPMFTDNRIDGYIVLVQDITKKKRNEYENDIRLKLYKIINESYDFNCLLQNIVEFLKDNFGTEAIGIRLKKYNDYPYCKFTGFSEEFIKNENSLVDNIDIGKIIPDIDKGFLDSLCGKVISGEHGQIQSLFTEYGSFYSNSISELAVNPHIDFSKYCTRAHCLTHGYNSMAFIPLRVGTHSIGLIQLNDKRKNCFTPESISLLEELSVITATILFHKLIEKDLFKSEEKYNAIIDNINDTIYSLDKNGKILYISSKLEEVLKYSPMEILGKHFSEFVHPDDLSAMNKSFSELLSGIEKAEVVRIIDKDGEIKFFRTSSKLLYEEGEVMTLGMLNDLTDYYNLHEALRSSEEKYRQIVETSQEGIIKIDENYIVRYVNPKMLEILNYSLVDFIGISLLSIIDEDDEEVKNQFINSISSFNKGFIDLKLKDYSGKTIYSNISTSPIFNENGNFMGAILMISDITTRKIAEMYLEETREYLENLINYSSALIVVWTPDFKLALINNAFKKLTGYTEEEIKGEHLSILFPKHSYLKSIDRIMKTTEGEFFEFVEIPIVLRNNDIKTILWNTSNMYFEDSKKIKATIAQGIDITERKKAEEELKKSEEKYRQLIELAQEGILVISKNEIMTFANNRIYEMLGYKPDEILDKPIKNLIFKDDIEDYEEKIKNRYKGISERFERRFQCKDGNVITALVSAVPIYEEDKIIGSMAVLSNITEFKELVNEKSSLQEQILNTSKLAIIGEMSAAMAHQLNQPLTAISMTSEKLIRMINKIQETQALDRTTFLDKLNLICSLVDKSSTIITQMRTFSRMDLSHNDIIDINELLNDTLVLFVDQFHLLSINIRKEYSNPLTNIIGNRNRLEQVVINILSNSKDAFENNVDDRQKIISIKTSQDNVNIRISISDNGPGMSDATIEKLFEPFYTTKIREKGTGLGLSICKRIIEEHHGSINIKSKVDEGTEIEISLPIK